MSLFVYVFLSEFICFVFLCLLASLFFVFRCFFVSLVLVLVCFRVSLLHYFFVSLFLCFFDSLFLACLFVLLFGAGLRGDGVRGCHQEPWQQLSHASARICKQSKDLRFHEAEVIAKAHGGLRKQGTPRIDPQIMGFHYNSTLISGTPTSYHRLGAARRSVSSHRIGCVGIAILASVNLDQLLHACRQCHQLPAGFAQSSQPSSHEHLASSSCVIKPAQHSAALCAPHAKVLFDATPPYEQWLGLHICLKGLPGLGFARTHSKTSTLDMCDGGLCFSLPLFAF